MMQDILEKTDLFSKFDGMIALRESVRGPGREDPFGLVMERVVSPTVAICNGRETILLGTYNYMGMTFDPDVIAAGKAALDAFGSGTTGSRVLNGTYAPHKDVEAALRAFYAMDHAMVFSTGYQANLGIISTIAGKGDYIVLDIDSHASIWDGCKLGDAEVVPFKHNDIAAMEKRLKRIPEGAGKLVILEGVYSMLGDIAPLKDMIAIAKANGAMVLVDAASPKTRAFSTMSISSSAPFPNRSAPSAVSAFPIIPSSKSCAWPVAPTSSPPACRHPSSPPPPPASAS